MSDFSANITDRHKAVGQALHRAFDPAPGSIAESDIKRHANDPGFTKKLAIAQAAACIEGLVATVTELGEAHAPERAMLIELAVALRDKDRIDREQVAQQLRQAVRLLGSGLIAPDILAGR